MINKDISKKISKIFCFRDSLPKAPSTSCLNSSCKSNSTHLTQNLSQDYDFQNIILLLEVELNGKLPRVKLTKWTWLALFIVLVPPLQSSPKFMQTNPLQDSF